MAIPTKLKKDEYHTNLFKEELHMIFDPLTTKERNQRKKSLMLGMNDETLNDSKYDIIEDLPRGAIIGLMIFSNAEWFSSQNTNLMNNRWAYGPFCYHIQDVHRLKIPMTARGQLGSWIVKQSMHARIMLENPDANQKIHEWKKTYASNMMIDNQLRAITIQQPFTEAILRGLKTVENRKRSICKLSPTQVFSLPKHTQCKFCPISTKEECVFWLHGGSSVIRKRNRNTFESDYSYHSSKKKRKRSIIYPHEMTREEYELYEDEWCNYTRDVINEENTIPVRVCKSGFVCTVVAKPMDVDVVCVLCNTNINWDNYYQCQCRYCMNAGMPSNLCFNDTFPFKVNVSSNLKKLSNIPTLERMNFIKSAMQYSIKYPLPPQTPVRISIIDSDSDSKHKRSHHRHKHRHRKKHKHRRRKHRHSDIDIKYESNIKCQQPIIDFLDLEERMLSVNQKTVKKDIILPPMEELNRLIEEYGNSNNHKSLSVNQNIPLLPNAMLENSPLHLPAFLHQFPSINDINKFLDELDVAPYNASNVSSIPVQYPTNNLPSDSHPFSISSISNLPFSYAFNDPTIIKNKKQNKKKKKKKKKKKRDIPKFKEKNETLVQQPLYSYPNISGIYHYNNHNNNYYINTFNTNTNINANTMMINNNNYPMSNVQLPLLPLPVQAFSSQQQLNEGCIEIFPVVIHHRNQMSSVPPFPNIFQKSINNSSVGNNNQKYGKQ